MFMILLPTATSDVFDLDLVLNVTLKKELYEMYEMIQLEFQILQLQYICSKCNWVSDWIQVSSYLKANCKN